MKQKEEINELDVLLPESEALINGETIEIKPFPFAKLPKVINLLSKMGAGIYKLFSNDGLHFDEKGSVIVNQAFIENVGAVVEEHFPEVVELIAIYTDKDSDFYIGKSSTILKTDICIGINAEDGLMLLIGIIERNYDFFTKRLAPAINKIKAKQK